MADGYNKAILIGRLGADPELKYTAAGQALLKFRLATNESWKDAQGEKHERTDWHNIVIWGKRGEGLNRVLSKGGRIGVEGQIRTSKYEAKDGTTKTRVEIVAQNVVLLDGRRSLRLESSRHDEPGSEEPPQERDLYAPDLEGGKADNIPF